MSFLFVSSVVFLVVLVSLCVIGILLCLYLSINDNFEVQPCSLSLLVHQQRPTEGTEEKTHETDLSPDQSQQIPLLQGSVSSLNPVQAMRTAEKVWSFVDSK
jgi:hypothetical protein